MKIYHIFRGIIVFLLSTAILGIVMRFVLPEIARDSQLVDVALAALIVLLGITFVMIDLKSEYKFFSKDKK